MRPAFSLLEVLVAAALLGLVVVACLPLLRPADPVPRRSTPDRRLGWLARPEGPVAPPNATIDRFESRAGEEIGGEWIVVSTPTGYAVLWRETDPDEEGRP